MSDGGGGGGTREVILAVSARLFAARGIEGTTMRAIAEGCAIKAASLYNHFASKDEIVAEVMSRSAQLAAALFDEVRASELSPAARLEALMQATLRSFRAHPEASRMFFDNAEYVAAAPELDMVRARAKSIDELWERAIADASAAGLFRGDIDPAALWPLLQRMTLAACQGGGSAGVEASGDAVLTVLLHGILRDGVGGSAEE